jgi:hypothetical protein
MSLLRSCASGTSGTGRPQAGGGVSRKCIYSVNEISQAVFVTVRGR